MVDAYGISLKNLGIWNPSLGDAGLPNSTFTTDLRYCVGWRGDAAAGSGEGSNDLTSLASRLSQASPVKCDAWYMARNVDSCATVEGLFGLTDAPFNVWNLAVTSDCVSGFSLDENLQYIPRVFPASLPDFTALNLTLPNQSASLSSATLEAISNTAGCALTLSWLTLDAINGILYCLDRGSATVSGSLSSFRVENDGSLTQLDRVEMIYGAVSAVIYGNEGAGLAVAHYTSSSFSAFSIADPAELKPLGNKGFPHSQHGPKPQQDAPHPHQALLDPTGAFILVPDLGADLVRIFKISGLDYTELDPLVVSSGSGPRHATFLATGDNIYMYLVSEIANTITGYNVTYINSSLHFDELFSISTHGPDGSVPNGTSAAEITLSPDKRFLIVSSRGENSHTIPNFDTNDTTEIVSDVIISFSIDHSSGELSYLQSFPSGGRVPRQFSINKAGDLVAVGLQSDSRVVVIERDVNTGLLKHFVASAAVAGEVTAVIFNE
ncbi:extracellular aldonolactonase [Seiridium cupressi]